MTEQVLPIVIAVAVGFVLVLGLLALVARFYRQVEQGKALIVNTMARSRSSPSPARSSTRSSTAPR